MKIIPYTAPQGRGPPRSTRHRPDAEDRERHDRGARPQLDRREEREQRDRGADQPQGLGRRPARRLGLDQRVDQHRDPGRDRQGPREVEAPVTDVGAALTQQRRGDGDHAQGDGDVEEEDPLPADGVGEDPSQQHAHRAAGRADGPQTPRAVLRSAPSRKVVIRIESAAGVMTAAPMPWNARAAIGIDHARPRAATPPRRPRAPR